MKNQALADAMGRLKALGIEGATPSIMSQRDGELILNYIKGLEERVDDEFGPFDEGAWHVYKPSWTNQ